MPNCRSGWTAAISGSFNSSAWVIASALLATIRNLGLATGTGLATGLFTWRHRVSQDFISALHFTLFAGGLISLAAMVASLSRVNEKKREA